MIFVFISVIGIIISTLTIFVSWKYYRAYGLLVKEIKLFSNQDISEEMSLDELSETLRNTNKRLELTSVYLRQLGNLNENELNPLVVKDEIGKALLSMQSEMKKLREEENYRNWITEGLAKFGEILRNKTELKDYTATIISNLVRYINGNQGGVFLCEEDQDGKYLELLACYAYDKERYLKVKVYEGDGLLGQCIYDHELVFITEVPDGYTTITSGLGLATPGCIIVLPLINNANFLGVIELALFEVLQSHQIEFLKKVSINIASEIGSIKTLEHTRKLLSESDQLSQKLRLSEEEMKETIFQLATTQEEMLKQKEELEKKQIELNSYLRAIENTVASIEFDNNKNVINANDIFWTISGYTKNDLMNSSYLKFMKDDESMKLMWQNIVEGKFFSGEFKMKGKDGGELWLNGTFNPIFDLDGKIQKIMMCAQFVTQEKEKLNELNAIVNSFKSTLPVVELSNTFQCRSANEKFLTLFGLTRLSIKDRTLQDFLVKKNFIERIQMDFSLTERPVFEYAEQFYIKEEIKEYVIAISLLKNLQGEIYRILVMFTRESK